MKRLTVLAVSVVIAAMAQAGGVTAETRSAAGKATAGKADQDVKGQGMDAASIRHALLNPNGFDMNYSCLGRSGHSRVIFREDGQNFVADISVIDIKNVDMSKSENFELETCTSNAQLSEGGVMFSGCSDESHNIFLAFEQGNKKTAFMGHGRDCPMVELSPR